ncbi:MAG: peptidoglycan recognition protein family protein [Candidatus Peribacteria bacterium]|jgi:N-acetyl-anhydromuramyl-L-alanine amidase AmpD|nr:peptidoglycan recognition protein family protein [Candidatus Peribacteria bacterium]
MKKNYPNDRIFDTSNDKMGDFYLLYQDQIKYNKTKLIVHHTAMVYDRDWSQQEIYEAIQRIYKYHTIDRDFGDLGYNFLIDHLGNIYEGRAGGIGAVGMHVAYNNIPSIGISLMGNYEEVQPTEDQIRALVNLLTALAKKYNINPEAKERYHQTMATYPYISSKQSRTIVGHRDIVATACPGKYLSQYLPLIRGEVKKRLQNGSIGDIPLSFIVENTLLTGEQSRS